MEIFNAPARESFCVRRDRTNTPLQALVALNDPQFVEASRQLAARTIASSADANARVQFIAARLVGRPFTDAECKTVLETLQVATATYQKDPDAAAKLISVGASKADPALAPAELAAWTLIANQILNLDEALTK